MRVASTGDRVRIHFTGKLRDGTVVGSSREDEPLEFTLGRREVMRGLEDLVKGMRSGEVRTAFLPADLAHGRHRNDLLLAVETDWESVIELQDIVAGAKPGRTSPEEITLFKSNGLALEDVAAAAYIYEQSQGQARRLPLLE